MKSKILKSVLLIALFATISSCTKNDSYNNEPVAITTYNLTTTKAVSDINTLATSAPTTYTTDDIIEAYVTSSDVGGNFYKSISFQTIPTDNTAPIGFSVSVDKSMLFVNGFTPGRKVYIKLMGLAYEKVFGSLLIGVLDPTSSTGISGISELDYQNYLFPSSTIVDESTMVRQLTLAQFNALPSAVADSYTNTLIDINNVEFADNSLARTYYDINSGGYATNHDIVDATSGGTTRYCRISQYCPFSANNVPAGRGTIRGVMTKYGTTPTNAVYQFMVRQESDFKLTNPRTYTFFSSLNETFASYATSQVAFPNYLNFSPVGTKKWLIKSGALEMSSYGGAVENNLAYFVVPVDMTAASTFQFDLKVSYFSNSTGLKVYRSMDYVPGMKISQATLFDISSSFSLAMPSANATLTGLTYNIPATVNGNGYFIFEYTGTNISTGPPVTTTVDIDNIIVN